MEGAKVNDTPIAKVTKLEKDEPDPPVDDTKYR